MRRQAGWFLALGIVTAGCTVPVASGLDDSQANQVVVALDRAGIGGEKEPDPSVEGRYRVSVERDDGARAIAALRDEGLPAPSMPGLLDSMGKGQLVPSQLAEHAQLTAGLSGELERTLSSIEGVLSARVHLSLPKSEPFAEGPLPKATGSVLLRFRGSTPPIDPNDVKRLVAGAAPGLEPDAVAVVTVSRPAGAPNAERMLSHLGPIAATRGSVLLLRLIGAVTVLVDLALAATVLWLWSRLRRSRTDAPIEAGDQKPARL
jgi:type III secretion protein J